MRLQARSPSVEMWITWCNAGSMKFDHVSYACGPEGLLPTSERIADTLGLEFVKGGVHPSFGTRNVIFPLRHGQFLEVVEVLEHPASLKAPFGQAVRARSEMGGGWMGWVVSVEDLAPFEDRLGRSSVPGHRRFPDGRDLTWKQIGIKGLIADPQLPYIIRWDEDKAELHPSRAIPEPHGEITGLTLAGNRTRVLEWLGSPAVSPAEGLNVSYESPSGMPGLMSVTFETPRGSVTL